MTWTSRTFAGFVFTMMIGMIIVLLHGSFMYQKGAANEIGMSWLEYSNMKTRENMQRYQQGLYGETGGYTYEKDYTNTDEKKDIVLKDNESVVLGNLNKVCDLGSYGLIDTQLCEDYNKLIGGADYAERKNFNTETVEIPTTETYGAGKPEDTLAG